MHRWGSILSKIGNDAKSPSRTTSNQSKSCLLLSIQPATSPFLDSLLSVPGLSFSLSHPFLFLYFSLSPQKRALPPSRFFLSLSLYLSPLSLSFTLSTLFRSLARSWTGPFSEAALSPDSSSRGRNQGEPEVPGYEFPARTICSAKLNDRLR